MTDKIRDAAQALDKLQTAVEAYANAPSLVLLGEMRETFATLRAALSAPQPAADERVAEHMRLVANQLGEYVTCSPGHLAAVESSARALLAAGREEVTALQARIAELEARQVTEEMITAYLEANDAYWIATDKIPRPPGKWRTGTPREATRASLVAALAAAPSNPTTQPPEGR